MGTFLTKKEKKFLRKSAEGSLDIFRAGVQAGKQRYAGRKESIKARRLEKARIVHAIRESNLPQSTQRREINKLGQSRFSRIFGKRDKPTMGKARFGTEAEQ